MRADPSRPSASRPRPDRSFLHRLHREQAGYVMSFLFRIFLAFAVVGLAVEEAGQIALAQIHASNAAGNAAQAGADEWVRTHNRDLAYRAALAAMAQDDVNATITAFDVGNDGSVTVTAEEQATTLIVEHISFLKHFGIQHSTETEIHSLANSR
jgi:hypothetical protein